MKFNLGLCSISFRQHSVLEILQSMKNAGLSYIEWGSDVHVPGADTQNAEKTARLQAEFGIRCSSYGTYFRIGVNPPEEISDYIKTAKILGTDVLRLWCGSKNSEEYTEEDKQKLFEACRQLSKIAEQNEVVLCMECHRNTFTNRPESALELMQNINSQHFKMYWQPNQFRTGQENLESAKMLASYTVHIHMFNWEDTKRFSLRDARDIWRQYLAEFNGDHTLLLEFMPDDRIESLQAEADALKEIAE